MIITETENFFNLHWNCAPEAPSSPAWCFDWDWEGPVPYHLLPGLYALFNDETLVYIGLGRSGAERGISARLEKHVLKITNENGYYGYKPQPKWDELGINRLATIGFPHFAYLAPALEDYLIGKLQPSANQVGKRSP